MHVARLLGVSDVGLALPRLIVGTRSQAAAEARAEFTPAYWLTVDATASAPHRDLRQTAADLRKRKPDDTGRIAATGDGCFSVRVAPLNVERTVRILNALCNGFTRFDLWGI